jgi:hypothetical protein
MIRRLLARSRPPALSSEEGNASVEFVLLFPIIFAMFVSSVDISVMMLRQVFLDRALDLALRDVRLGIIQPTGLDSFKDRICQNAALTPNCRDSITVELRPVTVAELHSFDPTARCVNRAHNVTPMLQFTPGSGNQELMLIRACTVANPFIVASGFIFGAPRGPNDDFMSVSIGIFVNEPV